MDKMSEPARRADLQARLAAERANLFYALRGLDEETLCTAPLDGGWTVRDILPHLGYWDAFTADRLEKLIDGRREDIQWLDPDALDGINAEVRLGFGPLDLGQAAAIAIKERNGFLVTLARMPDEVLFGRVNLGASWRVSPSTWVRRRHRHDAEHAAQINAWRRQLPVKPLPKPPASKIVLRPFLAASRRELMALARLLAPGEQDTRPICGAWTLRDVLGHLTLYEALGIAALRELAAGNQPQPDVTIRNFDAFNQAQALARQPIGWEQTLAEYKAVRKGLMTLVDHLSDSDLMRPFEAPWGSAVTSYQYVFGLGIHEQEHAAMLRQALGLRALPQRLRHYRLA